MVEWIIHHWIEIAGTLFGLAYVLLEVKQHNAMWFVGIITSLLYIIVFFQSQFYADMGLQVYYVFVSVYGWFMWKHGGGDHTELQIQNIRIVYALVLAIITVLIFFIISYILVHYTDSPVPYWDSFTTALSITATYMLAHKYIEQWFIWMIVNGVSIWLYWNKELYSTVVLFSVYFILSVIGYTVWFREHTQAKHLQL
ncbi:MAG TPA: nicotinamide riboside transporter PnuC [Bacteroidales bacterium]|nr:nicotinamide riboside transporter PnuC [Bacteroidales bacterium]HRS19384.1 nicotinamide riboside transporter PnuC [Bacteroidales bacterium]